MFVNATYNWHFGTRGMSFGRIMKISTVILIVSRQKQIQLCISQNVNDATFFKNIITYNIIIKKVCEGLAYNYN